MNFGLTNADGAVQGEIEGPMPNSRARINTQETVLEKDTAFTTVYKVWVTRKIRHRWKQEVERLFTRRVRMIKVQFSRLHLCRKIEHASSISLGSLRAESLTNFTRV